MMGNIYEKYICMAVVLSLCPFSGRRTDMKIRTIVNLTEAQKVLVVSRNESFPQRICTFEISPEKTEIISRLKGTIRVESGLDGIVIQAIEDKYSSDSLQVDETYGYNAAAKWMVIQQRIFLKDVLAEAYATGTIKEGSNIDFALDIMAEGQKRCEAIEENNKVVQAEKARKEEEERPAKEAQVKADAEARAERERIEKEEKARKDAEVQARNEAIEAEKKAWIDEHGSERLQIGYAQGYRCQKLYEIERAQSILGSDYTHISPEDEKDRSCPSLKALQEVERLKTVIKKEAEIVWLPHGAAGEEETGCEAVKADPGTFSQHYFYKTF